VLLHNRVLAGMYGSHTRAQSVNTRIALATTKKGSSTMAEFYSKMKSYADEMAASGHCLGDEEFVAYVLTGLNEEIYNSLMSSIVTRVEPISRSELYSQMLSYELRLDKQSGGGGGFSSASTNAVSHGRGSPWHSNSGPSCGHGHSRGNGCGALLVSCGGYNNSNNFHRAPPPAASSTSGGQNCPQCQVCFKIGPTVQVCWYHYNEDYNPDNRAANMPSTSGTDPNWYLNSGAMDHIIRELEKLTLHDHYNSNNQIRVANGAGMDINHIGKSVVPTLSHPSHLNHVLHVPQAHKHLISIHRFILDNHTFIELHPYCFLIEDRAVKRCCFEGHVGVVSILCRCICHLLHTSSSSRSSNCPLNGGTIVWVIFVRYYSSDHKK
jgi:hypothetical protein